MTTYLINQATKFFEYIAEGDDALTEELERVGAINLIKALAGLQMVTASIFNINIRYNM